MTSEKPRGLKRLAPEDRHREIVDKAADFFSVRGFDGATRDLAKDIGVTQPLLYRYFPTKEALVREVYQTVFIDIWKPAWDDILNDRSVPVAKRLNDFYNDYTDNIMNARWIRIYFYAALRDAEINTLYTRFIEEKILKRVIIECQRENTGTLDIEVSAADMESAWILHGGIFHYGVRLHIFKQKLKIAKSQVIENAVNVFLHGFFDQPTAGASPKRSAEG